jgi:hypothetical protein
MDEQNLQSNDGERLRVSVAPVRRPVTHTRVEQPKPKGRKFLRILFTLVIVLLLGGGGYFAYRYFVPGTLQFSAAALQPADVVERVAKLMMLPTEEQPTVATVSDLEKLKNQPFFTRARIGDYVLIYMKSKKAILYNATENKIIEVGALNTDGSNAGTSISSGSLPSRSVTNTSTTATASTTKTTPAKPKTKR